jgi:hypothetical protein
MTRAEIDQRNSVFPTELFRKFMSVNVSPSRTGPITQWFALSRREGGNPTLGACPMQVYLDRVPLPNPFNLDLLPSPKEITGIEVYAGQRRSRRSSTVSIEGAASFSSGRATEGDHVNANERTLRRRRDPITLLL